MNSQLVCWRFYIVSDYFQYYIFNIAWVLLNIRIPAIYVHRLLCLLFIKLKDEYGKENLFRKSDFLSYLSIKFKKIEFDI